MNQGRRWLVAGLGCRQACTPAQLQALLLRALALVDESEATLDGAATFERRLNAPAVKALASTLGVPIAGYAATALARFDAQLSHRSVASWRHTGCYGVAEACALAHCARLSGTQARLLVTRLNSAQATVALAIASST